MLKFPVFYFLPKGKSLGYLTKVFRLLKIVFYINFLPPAYVVRGKVMFWQASVLPSIHLSVHRGGVPISHNALQHFPECHEAAGGGTRVRYPPRGDTQTPPGGAGTPPGGTRVRYPPGGYPGSGTPPGGVPGSGTPRGVPRPPRGGYPGQVPPPRGGYPGRTTEGVLTTRRAVCLLRSRRRTFLL